MATVARSSGVPIRLWTPTSKARITEPVINGGRNVAVAPRSRRLMASSARLRTSVIPPEIAPWIRAGTSAAEPCIRLANRVHPPMATNANATCTKVARASFAREILACAMSLPAPIRVELLPGWTTPPLSPVLLLDLGAVRALSHLGALAAAILPHLKPDQDYTNLR